MTLDRCYQCGNPLWYGPSSDDRCSDCIRKGDIKQEVSRLDCNIRKVFVELQDYGAVGMLLSFDIAKSRQKEYLLALKELEKVDAVEEWKPGRWRVTV